jgi:hypothetical protein
VALYQCLVLNPRRRILTTSRIQLRYKTLQPAFSVQPMLVSPPRLAGLVTQVTLYTDVVERSPFAVMDNYRENSVSSFETSNASPSRDNSPGSGQSGMASTSNSYSTKDSLGKSMDQRRKRASKPKVRTGCISCKRRHVKCDEGKPTCVRCDDLGIPCEGYMPPKNTRRTSEPSTRLLLPKFRPSDSAPQQSTSSGTSSRDRGGSAYADDDHSALAPAWDAATTSQSSMDGISAADYDFIGQDPWAQSATGAAHLETHHPAVSQSMAAWSSDVTTTSFAHFHGSNTRPQRVAVDQYAWPADIVPATGSRQQERSRDGGSMQASYGAEQQRWNGY